MKLRALWIGRTKDPGLIHLIDDYRSRIVRFLPFETTEVREAKGADAQRREAEGEKILAAIDATDRVVLLDPRGKALSSEQFAAFLGKHMREDQRRLTFVIAGFSGPSGDLKERADVQWSLSPLTFTHDLCRVLLLEQLYRGLAILKNHPYSR